MRDHSVLIPVSRAIIIIFALFFLQQSTSATSKLYKNLLNSDPFDCDQIDQKTCKSQLTFELTQGPSSHLEQIIIHRKQSCYN